MSLLREAIENACKFFKFCMAGLCLRCNHRSQYVKAAQKQESI